MENPFFRKEKKVETERILPSDVRYAFQYKEAKLGISEMRDLIANGFEQEALYVVLKGAGESPELEHHLLQGVVDVVIAGQEQKEESPMRAFLSNALLELQPDVSVEAQKLALISRVGFAEWHRLYEKTATELAESESEVFLLAHSTFVGLPSFIEEFNKTQKTLHILVPDFFEDEENAVCGYVIKDGVVAFLPKDFARPADALLVDDVRHTGATEETARSFWSKQEGASAPTFTALYEAGS